MKLEVNGIQYDHFMDASATLRLLGLSNEFRFGLASTDAEPLPIRVGDSCKVIVDGEAVLTGTIEVLAVRGDERTHAITIAGRDRTRDLVDSELGRLNDLKPPISLKRIIERVIQHLGSTLEVVDNLSPTSFNQAEDLIAPEAGDNAFKFLERFARKRQALLTSDSDGNVVITQGTPTRSGGTLLHDIDNPNNNVINYAVQYDLTGRYNKYLIAAQRNAVPAFLSGSGLTGDALVDQGANQEVLDPDQQLIVPGRQKVITSESMFSDGEAKTRLQWEANTRRSKSVVYQATVDGYRDQDGNLWGINRLVRVDDKFAGVDTVMLVQSVTFGLNDSGGSLTRLDLVDKESYTLALSEPETEKKEVGLGILG